MATFAVASAAGPTVLREAMALSGMDGWIREAPRGTVLLPAKSTAPDEELVRDLSHLSEALGEPVWLLVNDGESAELLPVVPGADGYLLGWEIFWQPQADPLRYLRNRKDWDDVVAEICRVGGRPEAARALAAVRNDPPPGRTGGGGDPAAHGRILDALLTRACDALGLPAEGIGFALPYGRPGTAPLWERIDAPDRGRILDTPGKDDSVHYDANDDAGEEEIPTSLGTDLSVVLWPSIPQKVAEEVLLAKAPGWVVPLNDTWTAFVPAAEVTTLPLALGSTLTAGSGKAAVTVWWGPGRAGFVVSKGMRTRGGHEWRSAADSPWVPDKPDAAAMAAKVAKALPGGPDLAAPLTDVLLADGDPLDVLGNLIQVTGCPPVPLGGTAEELRAWAANAPGAKEIEKTALPAAIYAASIAPPVSTESLSPVAKVLTYQPGWLQGLMTRRPVWFRLLAALIGLTAASVGVYYLADGHSALRGAWLLVLGLGTLITACPPKN